LGNNNSIIYLSIKSSLKTIYSPYGVRLIAIIESIKMPEKVNPHLTLPEAAPDSIAVEPFAESRLEVARQLTGLFNPLCHEVALHCIEATSNHELAQPIPTYVLPNPEAALYMPWDFLRGEDTVPTFHHTDLERAYRSEANAYVIGRYAIFYEDGNHKRKNTLMRGILLERSSSKIAKLLTNRTAIGEDNFDLVAWKAYEAAVENLPDTTRSMYSSFFSFRFSNTEKARDINFLSGQGYLKSADSVVYGSCFKATAHEPGSNVSTMMTNIVIPVGEYGDAFARALIQTTAAIMDSCSSDSEIVAAATAATKGHEQVLGKYTARGHDSPDVDGKTTATTLREGILSVGQVLAQLTSQKVEGYDDPIVLLESIVASGLVEELTRTVPSGIIGPLSLSGSYLNTIIERSEEGLVLSPGLKTTLAMLRERQVLHSKSVFHDKNLQGSKLTGTICPVAGKNKGLRRIAESFVVSLQS
jgi:hypothetical protein